MKPNGIIISELPEFGLPCEPNPIVAIQVQTTLLTGAGVEIVSYTSNKATHWSLYVRRKDGTAEWIKDLEINGTTSSNTRYGDAMIEAAKQSMKHGVPIEQVK